MNTNIYKYEFLARLPSVGIWSLSAAALILVFSSFFSIFADQAELMNDMLSKFPPELLTAFGMNRMNLASVEGFYSLIFLFIQLCLAIQASNYGFGLVSVEETELTADFLLAKPVSRGQVLTSKLLAALTGLAVTNLVVWAITFTAIEIFRGERTYDSQTMAVMLAGLIVFQLFFLGIGLVVSLLVKRVRNVTPYGLGLGFGMYVLNAFSGMLGDVKLEMITPFKHFDAAAIAQEGSYNWPLVLLNVAVTLTAIAASYWLYTRRDIPSVS